MDTSLARVPVGLEGAPGRPSTQEATVSPSHPVYRWFERGGGEPVVLLHGLMGEPDHWERTLEALAPWCRAIAPQVPILDPAGAEPSVEGLTHHVGGFLEALDLGPAVVGATRSVPHLPTTEFLRGKMEEIFYDATLVTPSWVESVRRILTTRALARRVLHVARSAKRSNLETRLGEIQVPTLLVWGKDDRITPPEVAERFRALLPAAELVFIANCGHAPMLEQPATFNAIIGDWLHETRAQRRAVVVGG